MTKVRIIHENCDSALANNIKLPNNAYLIEYVEDETTKYDVVQSMKVVDIFDEYWDKYKSGLKNITQSRGQVNPKLWSGKVDG